MYFICSKGEHVQSVHLPKRGPRVWALFSTQGRRNERTIAISYSEWTIQLMKKLDQILVSKLCQFWKEKRLFLYLWKEIRSFCPLKKHKKNKTRFLNTSCIGFWIPLIGFTELTGVEHSQLCCKGFFIFFIKTTVHRALYIVHCTVLNTLK